MYCRSTIGVTADIPLADYVKNAQEEICHGGWRNFPLETSENSWGMHLSGQIRHIKSTAHSIPFLHNANLNSGIIIGIRYNITTGRLSFYVDGGKVYDLDIASNLKLYPAVHLCHQDWLIVANFRNKAPDHKTK